MADMYFTEDGDITINNVGDISLTQTQWRDDVQAAYIRIMTDDGDFLLYPALGASLSMLYGMPQSPATGDLGVQMIQAALAREGRFVGKSINVQCVPTGYQSLRFDVYITSGSRDQIKLSVEQKLGVL